MAISKSIFIIIFSFLFILVALDYANAQSTLQAQTPSNIGSTLKIIRGVKSNTIRVTLNRAVVMESDIIFGEISVANPEVADVAVLTDRSIYIIGKRAGRTTLTLLETNGKLITNVEIHVSADLAEFKELLKEILPKEKIQVRAANSGIVLNGTVSSPLAVNQAVQLAQRYAADAAAVTNLLTVGGTQQVMLKVRFAEMNRNIAKELSNSLGVVNSSGSVAAGSTVFSQPSNLSAFANNVLNNSQLPIITNNSSVGVASFGFTAGGLALSVLLEALESKGIVRTLAEPNLTTLSGKRAYFLAGGEYPVPIVNDEGELNIQFKNFGVEMEFTPTVLANDTINLVITSRVSDIDMANAITLGGGATTTVPAFSTRSAETVVELRDGQSITIAGLLRDDFSDLVSQVPWFGDIPIIGSLFRSAEYRHRQTELIIIVTPHLVVPVASDALALPIDRIRLPSESELFLLGKTAVIKDNQTNTVNSVAKQDFSSPYGYIVE